MKILIISLKNSNEVLKDFAQALKTAKSKKKQKSHFEISFDNKKDFDMFVRNIDILSNILVFKPKSIYELAKLTGTDVSNLNKIILFFEEVGALKVMTQIRSGRKMKTPVLDYDKIEFKLAA